MKKNKHSEPPRVPMLVVPMNLTVTTQVCPVVTLTTQPIFGGGPIMREGFITETGLLTASSHRSA
ncbi:MAG TPA: hypothetical protein VKW78_11760 [Terriglobales bacterium]|nr:hypothetical protein [Terriglobales bacterium]